MLSNQRIPEFKIGWNSRGWDISDGDRMVLHCYDADYTMVTVPKDNAPLLLTWNNNCHGEYEFIYTNLDWEVKDTIQALENGVYEINRQWKNVSVAHQEAVVLFEVSTGYKPDFHLIPCVNYNGNKWGDGMEPKGFSYNNKPWIFAYNRSGIPSATFSENDQYSVGLFASAADNDSLISADSMIVKDDRTIHRIIWPEREGPVTYIGRDQYAPPVSNLIKVPKGGEFTAKFYLVIACVSKKNYGWTKAYDIVADKFTKDIKPLFDAQRVWRLAMEYVKNIQLVTNNNYTALEMGLQPIGSPAAGEQGRPWKLRSYDRYEIGWCGQNALIATALIFDYILNKNADSLKDGMAIIDSWERNVRLDNGLFYIKLDDVINEHTEAFMDTCNLGWGAWQILNAWELVSGVGVSKPNWLDMGLKLCDFFCGRELENASFGRLWNHDGICIDEGGTIGCFILLPLIKAFMVTKKKKYLERAIKAFEFYASGDLANMECTAGALDTHCIDKETCWPLLKTALDLYEITGDGCYLKEAVSAGYYTLSWMYHYDVVTAPESDFSKYGYHTYGGTAVSTQHHHIDPWGALLCSDWLRLYRYTGDQKWKIRAKSAWLNSLQCLSDGTLVIHDMLRPAGSQNEAFFHCNWGNKNNGGIGRMNDWLVSWPGAFRLMTLMREKNWELFDEWMFISE